METKTQNSVSEVIDNIKSFSLEELNQLDTHAVYHKESTLKNNHIGQIQRRINLFDKYEIAYFKKEYKKLLTNLGGGEIISIIKNLSNDEFESFINTGDKTLPLNKENLEKGFTQDFFISSAETYLYFGATEDFTEKAIEQTMRLKQSQCKKIGDLCKLISELDYLNFHKIIVNLKVLIANYQNQKETIH